MKRLWKALKGKEVSPEQEERNYRNSFFLSLTVLAFALALYVISLAV